MSKRDRSFLAPPGRPLVRALFSIPYDAAAAWVIALAFIVVTGIRVLQMVHAVVFR